MGTGDFIVLALAGFLGGFTFLFGTDFALTHAAWCITSDTHCVRDWVAALSGWAAAAAAVGAIPVLMGTLKTQRRSAEQQLRAYVYVDTINVHDFVPDSFGLRLTLKNFGATPAYDVGLYFAWRVVQPNRDLRNYAADIYQGWSDIAPTQGKSSTAKMNMDDVRPFFVHVESGFLAYYIYGHVRYRDVFGVARDTWFQFQLNGQFADQDLGISQLGNASN